MDNLSKLLASEPVAALLDPLDPAQPERTAFVWYRRLLAANDLDRPFFDAVTLQLRAKAVTAKGAGSGIRASLQFTASSLS